MVNINDLMAKAASKYGVDAVKKKVYQANMPGFGGINSSPTPPVVTGQVEQGIKMGLKNLKNVATQQQGVQPKQGFTDVSQMGNKVQTGGQSSVQQQMDAYIANLKAQGKNVNANGELVNPTQQDIIDFNKKFSTYTPGGTGTTTGKISYQEYLKNQGLTDSETSRMGYENDLLKSDLGAFQTRAEPTVATKESPVVDKTLSTSFTYDPTNPQDFIDRMQARVGATGKAPNEEERYNLIQAKRAIEQQQKEASIAQGTPYDQQIKDLQAKYDELMSKEATTDAQALEQFKAGKEIEYAQKLKEAEALGEKQKQAQQTVFSFSGFGRSTAAAEKQAEIQGTINNAIQQLQAQKQLEIQMKQAELEGATSKELEGYRAQLEQFQKGAMDYQIESLKKTAEANQKGGATYAEAVDNLLKTVSSSGIGLENANQVKQYAEMARNADGTVNEAFVSSLPEDIQAIIRSAASTSQFSSAEAAKTVTVGSGKNAREFQWNPETQRYDIPVGAGMSYGGTYSGGGTAGVGGSSQGLAPSVQANTEQNELVNRLERIKNAVSKSNLPRAVILKDPDLEADLEYLRANMTFDKLSQMKKSGVKLGALSDADMRVLGQAAMNLSPGMKKESVSREVDRLITGLGGKQSTQPVIPVKQEATQQPQMSPEIESLYAKFKSR